MTTVTRIGSNLPALWRHGARNDAAGCACWFVYECKTVRRFYGQSAEIAACSCSFGSMPCPPSKNAPDCCRMTTGKDRRAQIPRAIAGSPGVKIQELGVFAAWRREWPGPPGYGVLPPAQPSNREEAGDERTPAADSSPTSVVPGDLQSNSR